MPRLIVLCVLMSLAFSIVGAQTPDTPPIITPENAHLLTEINRIGGIQRGYIDWSPDERWLAVGTSEAAYVYDTSDFSAPPKQFDDKGRCLSFHSPEMLRTCPDDGHNVTWNLITGEAIPDEIQPSRPLNIVVSPNFTYERITEEGQTLVLLTDERDNRQIRIPIESPWILHRVVISDDETIAALNLFNEDPALATATQLWDLTRDEPLPFLKHYYNDFTLIDFNVDGSALIVGTTLYDPEGGADFIMHNLTLWGSLTGESISEWHNGGDAGMFYPPETDAESRLYFFDSHEGLLLWDGDQITNIGPQLWPYEGGQEYTFSANGRVMATHTLSDTLNAITVWDIDSDAKTVMPRFSLEEIPYDTGFALSFDGSRLIEFAPDDMMRLRDAATGEVLRETTRNREWMSKTNFSVDGTHLILHDHNTNTVELWDVNTLETIRPTLTIPPALFSANGLHAAFWMDTAVKVVDLRADREISLEIMENYAGRVSRLDAAANQVIFTQPESGGFTAYDLITGTNLGSIEPAAEFIFESKSMPVDASEPIISPDGRIVAMHSAGLGLGYGDEYLFDAETGELIGQWEVEGHGVSGHSFSGDGQYLATVSYVGSVYLWPLDEVVQKLTDGRAIGLDDATLGLPFFGQGGGFQEIEFSQDDRYVLAHGGMHTFDPDKNTLLNVIDVHHSETVVSLPNVDSPDTNPDVTLLAAKTDDGVALWSIDSLMGGTLEPLALLPKSALNVREVAFSDDGTRLYVLDEGGVSVWGVKNTVD